MDEPNPTLAKSLEVAPALDALTAAQIRKLDLESGLLENERRLPSRLVQFVPLITVLVSVGGLIFTVNQFLTQRTAELRSIDKQRAAATEALLRSDLQELLVPGEKRPSAARLYLLFNDFATLLPERNEQRTNFTGILVEFIKNDADFSNVADARLELIIMERWPDYSRQLTSDQEAHRYIMYKYFQALRHLHDSDPEYFESISWEASTGYQVARYTKEDNFRIFASLVQGFAAHLDILRQAPNSGDTTDLLQEALDEFQLALKNASLTQEMFGWLLPLNEQIREIRKTEIHK
jgi:hypothetical protein